ncbi:hypothetical protein L6452_17631 [Arctium lappa]|uniref:Uncharacterized protein n=1 Tax=Arctium lappa TaxID=4217 RepID=A0ACB9C3T1_ARCLA|nr:hypothetical protein L6452_17631 [Arctium lappa]
MLAIESKFKELNPNNVYTFAHTFVTRRHTHTLSLKKYTDFFLSLSHTRKHKHTDDAFSLSVRYFYKPTRYSPLSKIPPPAPFPPFSSNP